MTTKFTIPVGRVTFPSLKPRKDDCPGKLPEPGSFDGKFLVSPSEFAKVREWLNSFRRDVIERAKYGRHKASGKTAMVIKMKDGLCIAQFDDFNHPHSHGWHLYLRSDFHVWKGK